MADENTIVMVGGIQQIYVDSFYTKTSSSSNPRMLLRAISSSLFLVIFRTAILATANMCFFVLGFLLVDACMYVCM